MADEKESEGSSGGLMKSLLELVDKAAGKSADTGSKGSALPVYLILSGLVVLGFAIMGWMAVRAKRQAAQLAYDLRKKEEEQKRLAEQAQLEQDAIKRAEAEDKVDALTTDIKGLKEKIEANEEAAVERTKSLAQATSWDDLVIVDKRKT